MAEEAKATDQDIVLTARKRFEVAQDANAANRRLAVEDTRFAMGDSDNKWQWPTDVSDARAGDNKVCLTVNLTAQHCNQIINEIRKSRPSAKVMPADNFSDVKTAEILSGLIRNIQSSSSADDVHDLAAEHSVYGGEGYWRITTEYESPSSFDQVIRIMSCPNPQLVLIDPYTKEQDRSDANWGFIFEDINKETFEREHPDIPAQSWEVSKDGWVKEDTVRVAEYFYCDYVKDKALLLADGSSILESKLEDGIERDGMTLVQKEGDEVIATIEIVKERETERKEWKWCKLVGGQDEPIDKKDWIGDYLPIISIVGKELNVDGKIVRKGIVRDLKDQARMVNYSYSESIQTVALQNKIPYMAASEAIKGYESEWKNANSSNYSYLPYNAYDEEGLPLPKPERQQASVMPAAQIQLLQVSTEEMRGASGQQNANFGIKSEASSGVGIQRLKAQGEIATYHFPDNLARGLKYEAVVLINLIQKLYDTKRVVRILGIDGKQEQATLDPSMEEPYRESDIGAEDIQKIFNPSLGRYDVVIDTGPSFQTQRQESFAALTEIARGNPRLMEIAGDLIMRSADFPMADELAKRLEKALPPEFRDEKGGGAEQRLAQITQEHQQMGQQVELMTNQLQDMQEKLQTAESGIEKTQIEAEVKQQIAMLGAATKEKEMLQDARTKQHQMVLDAQFDRDKLAQDKELAMEKLAMEAELAVYTAEQNRIQAERVAEINAGASVGVAGINLASKVAGEQDQSTAIIIAEKGEDEEHKENT